MEGLVGRLHTFITLCMIICMRTTLVIPDTLMKQLREKAARENKTISAIVEGAIRACLQPAEPPAKLRPLPTYRGGGYRVDVSNREALYTVMEADE